MALRKRQKLKFMAGEGAGDERANGDSATRPSVGKLLRSERERRNLTIDDVAANLRIRRSLIDAIEHGRFKELPGAPYAVGFIRTYADFLELDREEIIRRFRSEAEGIENHKELVFPRPLSESRLPGGVPLLMSAVVAAVGYAFWHFHISDEHSQMPRVAAVPERLASLADSVPPRQAEEATTAVQSATPQPQPDDSLAVIPTESPKMATEPAASKSERSVQTPSKPEPSALAQDQAAAPVRAMAALPAAPASDASAIPEAPADTSAQPRVFGDPGDRRVVIRAIADSWIQIRDTSGTVVFTRVMRAGDTYNVPDRPGLSLYTGSAGALEITVDGKVAPSVGQQGAVRRDILLDPDRLLAGTAVLDQKRSSSTDTAAPRPAAASPATGGQ